MIARFVRATQPHLDEAPEMVRTYVRYGVSPRGAQSLVLASKARALMAGRHAVSIDDVRAVAMPALRHRIQTNYEADANGIDVDDVIQAILDSVVARAA
jgi:MoxR-like ATPase